MRVRILMLFFYVPLYLTIRNKLRARLFEMSPKTDFSENATFIETSALGSQRLGFSANKNMYMLFFLRFYRDRGEVWGYFKTVFLGLMLRS